MEHSHKLLLFACNKYIVFPSEASLTYGMRNYEYLVSYFHET